MEDTRCDKEEARGHIGYDAFDYQWVDDLAFSVLLSG